MPFPGDLPNPGIKLESPVLQAGSLLAEPPEKLPLENKCSVRAELRLIKSQDLPGGSVAKKPAGGLFAAKTPGKPPLENKRIVVHTRIFMS